MEILNHPVLLALAVALSVVSSFFLWRGFREKNVPDLCLGVGLGIPPYDMLSFNVWLVGLAVLGLGLYLRNKMDSV